MSKFAKQLTAMLLSGMLVIGSAFGSVFAAEMDAGPGQTSAVAVEEAAAIGEGSEKTVDAAETSEAISEEEATDESATADDAIIDEVSEKEEEALAETPEENEADTAWEANQEEDEAAITEDTEQEDAGADSVRNIEEETSEPVDSVETVEEVSDPIEETDAESEEETEEEEAVTEAEAEVASDVAESDNTETVPEQEEDFQTGDVVLDAADEQDAMEGQEAADEAYDLTGTEAPAETETISSDAMMDVVSSGTCGDNLTWTLDDEGTLSISGTGEMINYNNENDIPWSSSKSSIKTVIIEDGVTNIGGHVFNNCSNLTSITIPDSVTSIGEWALRNCSSLASITLPEGLTSIGISAFSGCSSLTSITIPERMTSIGISAFSYCSGLTSITISDSVTSIGKEAFYGCSSLTSVTIPNSVTDFGDNAFFNCSSLTSIQILDGVTSIGNYAFSNCSSLTSITIPGSVTSFGNYAFCRCSSLTSIQIPDGGTSIGVNAFYECSSLITIEVDSNNSYFSSLDGVLFNKNQTMLICCPVKKSGNYLIPNTVTTIGEDAFYSTNLTSITIPESVKRIGYYAFADCSNLSDVYYTGSRDKWDQVDIYDSGNDRLLYEGVHCAGDIEVTEISLDKTSATLIKGGTLQLSFTVAPTNATVQSVSWNCSDEDVASVNKDGRVRGYSLGTATITATAMDGSGVTATCTVTVVNNDLCAFAEGTEENYVDVMVPAGKNSELRVTVSAIDDSELSSQWYKYDRDESKYIAIQGATDLSYTVASAEEKYYFEVSDQYGNRSGVEFSTHVDNCLHAYVEGTDSSEVDIYLAPGESTELRVTVSANDERELSSQWYDGRGMAIEGAVGTSYTIEPVTGQTHYEFCVRDQYGSIAYARFYVHMHIENHLQAYAQGTGDTEAYLYVTTGESAKLQVNVSADDKRNLRYQWFKIVPDGWGKLEYYKINGATGTSYTINSVTGFTRYSCEVEDQYSNQAEVRFYTCIAGFGSAQTIACGDAVSASANSEAGGGSYPVFRFIPAQTAKYVMYSTDGVDDPYLEILNESHDSLVRTASPFEDPAVEYDGKGHFRVEQVLEEGKTYYLVVGTYSNSSSCVLHLEKVSVAVTGIKLNKTSASLNITKTLQLTATVLPDDATDKAITWSSSNTKAATVDSNGKVKGVGTGTATITATAADGSGVTATCKVTVSKLSVANATVSGLTAKTYTGKALTQTPTVVLGATTLKLNTDYTLSYSNNTNVGTASLIITGIGNYTGTKTATFAINKAAQSITAKASAASVAVGKTVTVSITGAKGTKSYKSSNTAVATVTTAGKVVAKKVGAVTITATSGATTNYKAASKTVKIMVVPAATTSLTAVNQATGIKLSWNKVTGANGYKIYRGSTLVKTITSGSTVTFTDTKANTNGTKYTFKIVAKAATGDSTLSKSVVAYRVARPAISSATNSAAGKMTVKWAKNAKATGYQIQYSTSKTFASGNKAVSVTSASTVSKVIGSLTKSNTYYVRIRTYKTVGSTKYWSAWSAAKTVKISK